MSFFDGSHGKKDDLVQCELQRLEEGKNAAEEQLSAAIKEEEDLRLKIQSLSTQLQQNPMERGILEGYEQSLKKIQAEKKQLTIALEKRRVELGNLLIEIDRTQSENKLTREEHEELREEEKYLQVRGDALATQIAATDEKIRRLESELAAKRAKKIVPCIIM